MPTNTFTYLLAICNFRFFASSSQDRPTPSFLVQNQTNDVSNFNINDAVLFVTIVVSKIKKDRIWGGSVAVVDCSSKVMLTGQDGRQTISGPSVLF